VDSPGSDERRTLNQEMRKLLVEYGHMAASEQCELGTAITLKSLPGRVGCHA